MSQYFQVSKPFTFAKQAMLLLIAVFIIFASLFRLPEIMAGKGNLQGEFMWVGIVWFVYALVMLVHSFFMPTLTQESPAFRIGVCAMAFISYPLWIGILASNFFFREPAESLS